MGWEVELYVVLLLLGWKYLQESPYWQKPFEKKAKEKQKLG